ncbi:MAG: hypothetical protein ACRDHP_17495 [Ktedonobacterales bacterium]
MAKKSTATRQANAARRPQTPAKSTGVTLVRSRQDQEAQEKAADGAVATRAAPTPKLTTAASTSGAAKQRSAPVVERPRALEAPKPAKPAPKAETAPARQQAPYMQASRVARARATQRARAANVITPQHYAYVLKDLRLIAALAVAMFAIIIVLHFVLG